MNTMEVHPLIVGPVIVGFIGWLAWMTKTLTDLRETIAELRAEIHTLKSLPR